MNFAKYIWDVRFTKIVQAGRLNQFWADRSSSFGTHQPFRSFSRTEDKPDCVQMVLALRVSAVAIISGNSLRGRTWPTMSPMISDVGLTKGVQYGPLQ